MSVCLFATVYVPQDALHLRKGDLDGIVDELSDGEGDEEEGRRAMLQLEVRQDIQRTKDVVTALRDGMTTASSKRNKAKRGV